MSKRKVYAKRLAIVFVIIIAMFIYSCTEQNISNAKSRPYESLYDTLAISNPLNSYDTIGIIHNNGLLYIENNIQNISCENYTSNIGYYSSSYILSNFPCEDSTEITNLSDSLANFIDSNQGYCFMDSILNYYNLSSNVKFKLNNIIQTLKNNSDTTNYSSYIILIKNWENTIINDNNINSNEKEQLLQFGSVARYSLYYWWTIANSGSNPWNQVLAGCQGGKIKLKDHNSPNIQFLGTDFSSYSLWYKLLCVAISDAAGAAKFGYIGAIVSSAVTAVIVFSSSK